MRRCDIILTVYNQLELTQRCLNSVLKYFNNKDRLIIVDNGSDEKTEDYLERFKSSNSDIAIDIKKLVPNKGYIKAVNAGLEKFDAEFVCLLSNDTVVTEGWLDRMIDIMRANSDIGVMNPQSSNFGLYPGKREDIEDVAMKLKEKQCKFKETSACLGFCMLIRRQVIEKIGYLDEVYGKGYFEDTDFSRKAMANGFRCAIAQDSYVWHREHSTFKSEEIEEQFKKNKKIFQSRWGRQNRILYVIRSAMDTELKKDKIISDSLNSVKEGNWVYMVLNSKTKIIPELQDNANIILIPISEKRLLFYAFFFNLKKRKKKIDKIYIDNDFDRRPKNFLKFLLGEKVEELEYER